MSVWRTSPGLSEAEYLKIERAAEFKSEFFDGEMFAMAGGSIEHSLISSNLIREVGNRLEGKPCIVYNADLRIKIEATGLLTYPDLSVFCSPLETAKGTTDTAVNPKTICEVLSESTEAYDRGTKFDHYRQIPSLLAYLLVSQKEPRIQQFVRQKNGCWVFIEASGLESLLEVPPLEIVLALARVYVNVKFPPIAIRDLNTPNPL